jgi:oligoribonuclease
LFYYYLYTSGIRRWNPDVLKNAPPKSLTHRAMDDIKESLMELSFYKANIFK